MRTNLDIDLDHHSLLTSLEVREMFRVGRTKLYQLCKEPGFPRQVKLGRASRWIKHEVLDYLVALESSSARS